ncbi:DUF3137 domain-containing protein [Flammeovirga sp. SJP92]|uniref:DUF3137 domain-containing protein n=1 Tax=Flammeovirga sp. SJP92 TaxID=1775430 RepID=UPI0007870EA9|nr:DUF3137 domain-containing protein [Flammeovirga sp. SJP92]KXX69631.1 hypothetical protein AVL50_15330 [Flammeovirga sp. SJP92]
MISNEELIYLYNYEIKSELADLERQRSEIQTLRRAAIVLFVLAFLTFFSPVFFGSNDTETVNPLMAIFSSLGWFVLGLGGGLCFVFYYLKKAPYASQYKEKIVSKVIDSIDETWFYNATGKVSRQEYNNSELFSREVNYYVGDDLITGVIEHTDFKCSELFAGYNGQGEGSAWDIEEINRVAEERQLDERARLLLRTRQKMNSDTGKTKASKVFKGLFFHADFNKHFSGKTFVRSTRYGIDSNDLPKVELENEEFSRLFTVNATNQIEARYILTPAIMEAFINLHDYLRKPIDVSFVGSRVYCAVSFTEDLFEPPMNSTVYDIGAIKKVYSLLYFNKVIIQELNLNTRIWTKGASEHI